MISLSKYPVLSRAALLTPFLVLILVLMAMAAPPAFSAAAAGRAEVGRVDFALAGGTATGSDGKARPLVRGEAIQEGDLISTGAGRAQIRFTDGAFMSLQPQTDFRIDEYRYAGKADGNERGFFSLLKGGLRTITGVIGRSNRSTYQVKTAVATVGIRGTEYSALFTNPLTVSVTGGIINLTNAGGSLDVASGQSAIVKDANTAPMLTSKKPILAARGLVLPPDISPPPNPFEPIEPSTVTVSTLPPGTIAADIVFVHNTLPGHPGASYATNVVLNGSGQATAFQDPPGGGFTTSGTTSIVESGNDGIIAWGRWRGGTTGGSGAHSGLPFSGEQSFHYVVGIATADMPVTGTATYRLLGATSPTTETGIAGIFDGGSLSANFSTNRVNTVLAFRVAGQGYTTIGSAIPISGNTFVTTGAGTVSDSAGGCPSGCATTITGLFTGNAASRAGLAYSFTDNSAGKTVGVATFTKSSGGGGQD